jgi:AraC-like DNA-binding protein
MKITINPTSDKITDIFRGLGKAIEFSGGENKKDMQVQLAKEFGKGSFWYREIINGMGLVIVRGLQFKTAVEITYYSNENIPIHIINFIKRPGGKFTLISDTETHTITQGAYINCSHYKEIDTFLPGKPTDYVSIFIFEEYIDRYLSPYIQDLSEHHDGKNSGHFYHIKSLSPEILLALNALENIQLEGDFKTLFLESKTLELITLFFNQLNKHNNTKRALSQREKTHILQAKNILDNHLENPPTIAQLSRETGLNEYKLRNAFKELFGTTIYAYVQKQRMILAKKLIEKDELSVSEAGYQVGYSNLSHFAKAFKKEFGISPSQLKK